VHWFRFFETGKRGLNKALCVFPFNPFRDASGAKTQAGHGLRKQKEKKKKKKTQWDEEPARGVERAEKGGQVEKTGLSLVAKGNELLKGGGGGLFHQAYGKP